MLYLQRIVLLSLLLPAAALAGESQPTAASKPVDKKTCKVATGLTTFAWYKLAICTKLHKNLAPREKKIKSLVAADFPHFYKVVTTPPLSTWGKDQASTSIYTKPEADPDLTETACKMDIAFLKRAFIQDSKWKHALQQCWEGPHPLVHKAILPPIKEKTAPPEK